MYQSLSGPTTEGYSLILQSLWFNETIMVFMMVKDFRIHSRFSLTRPRLDLCAGLKQNYDSHFLVKNENASVKTPYMTRAGCIGVFEENGKGSCLWPCSIHPISQWMVLEIRDKIGK